jgi:hypothetical protein
MTRPRLDFALLERLRNRFLDSPAAGGDYWDSSETLAAYDATFGERIGWKWDAVLAELRSRGWAPPAGSALFDWGCGSGIAGRRVLSSFGSAPFSRLIVHDRSPLARRFAAAAAIAEHPGLVVEPAPDWGDPRPAGEFTLVISHVLNELPPAEGAQLLALVRQASAVLWVEPGTSDTARTLVALREELRETFGVIAPCTHAGACGLLTPENQPHWCHHFARPPVEAFTDGFWSEFSRRLGIDLRSLPYSFLVLARRPLPPPTPSDWSRVLGEPREYKGFAKVLSCESRGVRERMLQKRDAPALFKQMRRLPAPPLFAWELRDDRIVGGRDWRTHEAMPNPPLEP